MPAGYDIGVSDSFSAANQSGQTGAFNVTTGGGKQTIILFIVVGVVAVIGLLVWLKKS